MDFHRSVIELTHVDHSAIVVLANTNSKSAEVSGDATAAFNADGEAQFDALTITQRPSSNVSLVVSLAADHAVLGGVKVWLRPCRAGEAATAAGEDIFSCVACAEGTYSVHTSNSRAARTDSQTVLSLSLSLSLSCLSVCLSVRRRGRKRALRGRP